MIFKILISKVVCNVDKILEIRLERNWVRWVVVCLLFGVFRGKDGCRRIFCL